MSAETVARREAVVEVAHGKADGDSVKDRTTRSKATEWFLSPVTEDVARDTVEVNVGTRKNPNWVAFGIQVVDREEIRRIRKESSIVARDGSEETNELEANLQIAVRGIFDPNLNELAQSTGMLDPAETLRQRFAAKPGLIDQIAGEIVKISGYDDKDVREVDAVKG